MENIFPQIEAKRLELFEKLYAKLDKFENPSQSWKKQRNNYLKINPESIAGLIPEFDKYNPDFLVKTINLLRSPMASVFTKKDYVEFDLQKVEGKKRWGLRNREIAQILKEIAIFETY